MTCMTRLDPPPKESLPCAGWELVTTEAGRYATGLRATIQVWNGALQACRQLVLTHPTCWTDFTGELAAQMGVAPDAIAKALLRLTACVEDVLRQMEQHDEARGVSQATQLAELAIEAELFHDPAGDAYATIPADGHRETCLIKAKGFRRWLARQFYAHHDKAPGSQAVQDALGVLEGKALYDGPEYPVFTRLAEHEGAIYLDLANDRWETVEITSTGWWVMAEPPVKFRRTRGMLPLPHPVGGGSLDDLQPFVNVSLDVEADWRLLAAWLLAALRPRGPYPVLILHGEQGSAKSTTARVLRALVDPNRAPLRAEPRDGRDLIIGATNGWIIGLDNLSHLPPWLSDAICRLATGGGFATRELYTDAEEVLFEAQRPVILNGIEELATRGDLLDRAVILYLPEILKNQRQPEATFWQAFEAARPRLLGALLDAVSAALKRVDQVQLSELPRMADFASWVTAAESALGWEDGAFIGAYTGNREAAHELTLEASPIAPLLRQLAEHGFTGTASQLLQRLNDQATEALKRQKGWPGNGRVLSNALRRIAPNLRAIGVDVDFRRSSGGKEGKRERIIFMTTHNSSKN